MKIPEFIRKNLLLKITSLNTTVIAIRLFISIFVQRLLAEMVGESGIAKIGQLRNVSELIAKAVLYCIRVECCWNRLVLSYFVLLGNPNKCVFVPNGRLCLPYKTIGRNCAVY